MELQSYLIKHFYTYGTNNFPKYRGPWSTPTSRSSKFALRGFVDGGDLLIVGMLSNVVVAPRLSTGSGDCNLLIAAHSRGFSSELIWEFDDWGQSENPLHKYWIGIHSPPWRPSDGHWKGLFGGQILRKPRGSAVDSKFWDQNFDIKKEADGF